MENRFYSAVLRHPRWSLALLTLAIFGLITYGDFSDVDTQRRLQVTHWLWTGEPQVAPADLNSIPTSPTSEDLYFTPGFCDLPGKNGQIYAQFSFGQPLIMLPADILSYAIVDKSHFRNLLPFIHAGQLSRQIIVNLATFPAIGALSVILSYELLLLLGFSSRVSLAASVLMMVGSTFLIYMQDVEENSLMYLCYVASLVFALKTQHGRWRLNMIAAGIFAGFNLLIRLPNIVYLPPLFLLLIWLRLEHSPQPNSEIGIWQRAWKEFRVVVVYFGLPVLAFVVIDRYYQFYRFGEWLSTYGKQCAEAFARVGGYPPGYPFGYDPVSGFLGPFLSPDRSVFLFDPFLVFTVVFATFNWRRMSLRQRLVLGGAAFALMGLATAYANTYFWNGGGGTWGARHHVVPIEVICLIGFAFSVRGFSKFKFFSRALVVANLVVAIACQIIAMPVRAGLENRQYALGDPIRIFQLMRVRNLFHIALGDFEKRGLSYHDPTISGTAVSLGAGKISIFAFSLTDYVSSGAGHILIALWLMMLTISVVVVTAIVVRGFQE